MKCPDCDADAKQTETYKGILIYTCDLFGHRFGFIKDEGSQRVPLDLETKKVA